MTKTMNHTNCTHPATKAGRAACRRAQAARDIAIANEIAALVASYYDNSADIEDIMAGLNRIDPELTADYYHGDAEVEEIIARIR